MKPLMHPWTSTVRALRPLLCYSERLPHGGRRGQHRGQSFSVGLTKPRRGRKLPASVLNRKKTGFDIPTHDWFRGVLQGLLMDTVTPEAVRATGIFDARAIETLIRDHMERRINAGYHLWGLLTLFLWMKRWKVEVRAEAEVVPQANARVFATT